MIFGEVVRGISTVMEINGHAKGKTDNTAGDEVRAKIVDAGQCGDPACL